MKRRDLLALTTVTSALGFPAIVRAQDRRFAGVTLRMNGYGGDWDRILVEKLAQPLERKTGAKIVITPGTAISALAKVLAAPEDPAFDILMLDSPVVPDLLKAQISRPVTPAELKGLERAVPSMREFGNYGVPICASSSVLVYNKNRVKTPPRAYADFAKPEFKDRIALLSLDNGVGLWLLLALNQANGGTLDNVAPGFAALAKIKPNVLTITNSNVNHAQLIEQEEVWAGCYTDGRAIGFKKAGRPFEMVEANEGTYSMVSYLYPVKNSKNHDAVNAMLEEALSGEFSAGLAAFYGYRPGVDVKLPKEVADLMFKPRNQKPVDWTKVAANRAAWINQFNREFK